MTAKRISISDVTVSGFRALTDFSMRLSHLNVLVGPNNCGKSTLLAAFRLLAQAMRRAKSTQAVMIPTPKGRRIGWRIPEDTLPIAAENVHSNYADIDTLIQFRTSNDLTLSIYFPSEGGCMFFADQYGVQIRSSRELRQEFPQDIQLVPVLGPLEHEESIVSPETVRRNLMTTRASRNFRNYWFYNPAGFDEFAALVADTWPGMAIERPERSHDGLVMFCLEHRISRELYWAGFGFQIWLQLLTHMSRANDSALLVVDEPEVYLHPDVQRQLLSILRSLGTDVLLATHSVEIMREADPTEILLVDKSKRTGQRLQLVGEQHGASMEMAARPQNITLARLMRTRRMLILPTDTDFDILRRFARQVKLTALATGTEFTAFEVGRVSKLQYVISLVRDIGRSIGASLQVGVVYDRDCWSAEEAQSQSTLRQHFNFFHVYERQEIENYLLVPQVLQRALETATKERDTRWGSNTKVPPDAITTLLLDVTGSLEEEIRAGYIEKSRSYSSHRGESSAGSQAMFEKNWSTLETRLKWVPGKTVLAALRKSIGVNFGVTLTDHQIVTEFHLKDVPTDLFNLLQRLDEFRSAA